MKMRNIKCYLAGAVLALVAASGCNSAEVVEPNSWYSENFEVLEDDWQMIGRPNTDGTFYSYTFDKVPLNVSYYKGIVSAYIYVTTETGQEKQMPLPSVNYYLVPPQSPSDPPYYYSVKYDYAIGDDGTIEFLAYVSDYWTEEFHPGTLTFRVAIIW